MTFDTITGGPLYLAIPIAFAAGLVSFFSPCVLPLLPSYLGLVSANSKNKVVLGSVLFVLGFSTVFVLLGAGFGSLGSFVYGDVKEWIQRISGVFVILLGFVLLGGFNFAQRTAKLKIQPKAGLIGAPLLGVVFGLGWTPCIGPILGSILAFASMEDSIYKGILLLSLYSIGLAVPFVLSSLLIKKFLIFSKSAKKYLVNIKKISGIILIITGILIVTGKLQILGFYLIEYFPILQKLG